MFKIVYDVDLGPDSRRSQSGNTVCIYTHTSHCLTHTHISLSLTYTHTHISLSLSHTYTHLSLSHTHTHLSLSHTSLSHIRIFLTESMNNTIHHSERTYLHPYLCSVRSRVKYPPGVEEGGIKTFRSTTARIDSMKCTLHREKTEK